MDSDSFEFIDGARYIADDNGLVLVRVTDEADSDFRVADRTYKIASEAFSVSLGSVIIPDSVSVIEDEPIADGVSVGSVFVNSAVGFSEDAFAQSRLFVPKDSEYTGEAFAFDESYDYEKNGAVYADDTLLYVPKTFSGDFETAKNTKSIIAGAAAGCRGIEKLYHLQILRIFFCLS